MEYWLIAIGSIIAVSLIVLIVVLLSRKKATTDLDEKLQGLTSLMIENQKDMAVLSSKVEPVVGKVEDSDKKIEVLSERVSTFGQNQTQLIDGTGKVSKAIDGEITETIRVLRNQLTSVKEDLEKLKGHNEARQKLDDDTAKAIKRVEHIIAGTKSKGTAGENILENIFSQLPHEWQVRDFQIGGKQVEFALKLPNNLVLPIDSKWPATNLVEEYEKAEDKEQQKLKQEVVKEVLKKAREVEKYIDPTRTTTFAIAVVPDTVYHLSSAVFSDVYKMNVVLISYSNFLPYLLLVFHTILKASRSIDLDRLADYLQDIENSIEVIQREFDNKLIKGLSMITNFSREFPEELGKISRRLSVIQGTTPAPQIEGKLDEPSLFLK